MALRKRFDNAESSKRVAYIYSPDVLTESDSFLPTKHRNSMVHSLIEACGLLEYMTIICPKMATVADLEAFHSSDYLQYLVEREKQCDIDDGDDNENDKLYGFGYDCPLKQGIFKYCQNVAGGSISAAELLCERKCLVAIHWLGGWHHAKRSQAAGYCYVNDCVLAILRLKQNFAKVLYVDLDLHHGDGVEDAFCATAKVMTFSIHKFESGFFPGSGSVHDIGCGKGQYYSVNFPLKDGCNDETFINACEKVFRKINQIFKPNAVVCQVGADGLSGDPMRSFNLTVHSLCSCVNSIIKWQKPTLLLGGGGYNEANVARCWCQITASVLEAPLTEEIPEHEFFPAYGPDFEFQITRSLKKDLNCSEYLNSIFHKVSTNINKVV